MIKRQKILYRFLVLIMILSLGPWIALAHPSLVTAAGTPPNPVVAIHVSELTLALETMPAVPPTPTGPGTTGFQWWPTAWHYFIAYQSLEEALRSDGTPFVEVSDADISAGNLLNADGSIRYPILISLGAEATTDNEITRLRSFVSSGGFLFVGSSSFTRNPDGTPRGDFALANEMGLHMTVSSLQNWGTVNTFTKVSNNRLVADIPSSTLHWYMPLTAEDIPVGVSPSHIINTDFYAWQVTAGDALVLATGDVGPLLATRAYGQGRIIYHSPFQPLIGDGGYDSGMYSYMIYRRAIEWAFESANLPIIKLSPWQYPYNAAFMVRHDFEHETGWISNIETSAIYEHSLGVKGEYYFCTGVLRIGSGDNRLSDSQKAAVVASLQRAVSLDGATIGSHNGGLVNPVNPSLTPNDYDYWHWGPDEALDTNPPGYANGSAYAQASMNTSFQDIQGWFTGLDNGRPGCGASNTCPRTWVSPNFNATRNGSMQILEQLGVITTGEQKVGPFPHWTVSPTTSRKLYTTLSLPTSEWYIGDAVAQSMLGHTTTSLHAAVDFYYRIGALINIYSHDSSASGLAQEYVIYGTSLPNLWVTNSVGVYDWWTRRSAVTVTPAFRTNGQISIAEATISGATDAQTAVEMVVPGWDGAGNLKFRVFLNGALADPSSYRYTSYGIKVRVGTTVTHVEVDYNPQPYWTQVNWSGGAGQTIWADPARYDSAVGIDNQTSGRLELNATSGGNVLFTDSFTPPAAPVPFDWVLPVMTPFTNGAIFNTNNGLLNSGTNVQGNYGLAYTNTVTIDNHSVEADISFPQANSFGGGIVGRLNTGNGQRYSAWIYPEGSAGIPGGYGPAVVKLIKFYNWGEWGYDLGMQTANIPAVGAAWHHLKLSFNGSQIQIFYDNSPTPVINITDQNSDGHGVYPSGYAGIDFATNVNTYGPTYNNFVVRNSSNGVVLSDNFGPDITPQQNWITALGSWNINTGVLQGTSAPFTYANYYSVPQWGDYTVSGRIQFISGALGGGLGGRVNPANGAHYGLWVYPEGSEGGGLSNKMRLIKFSNWTTWSFIPMQEVNLPSVSAGSWHTLELTFSDNRIQAYFDDYLMIDMIDNNYDGLAPYYSGGISADTFTPSGLSGPSISVDDIVVRTPVVYTSTGNLLSSAYDTGGLSQWGTISWQDVISSGTSICIRTRTASTSELLSAATWSDCYATSGSFITSANNRWIQYSTEFTTSDPAITPVLYRVRINYSLTQVTLGLTPGWNLITLPLQPTTSYNAESLLNEIVAQGGNCSEINNWLDSGWQTYIRGYPFNNFDVLSGRGYFTNCSTSSNWTVQGSAIPSQVTLSLQPGWNLVGIPFPVTGYTAHSLLDAITSQQGDCSEIDRWLDSGWNAYIHPYPFNDFDILPYQGYFLKCAQPSTFTP